MATVEYVYNGLDNEIILDLYANSKLANLSGVTRVVVEFDAETSVDSNDTGISPGGVFDISKGSGRLITRFGHQSLTAGSYIAKLYLYDSVYDNGLYWGTVAITVVDL